MKNIAFINCAGFTEYGFKKLINGKNSIESVLDFALSLEDTDKAVVITDPDNIQNFEAYSRNALIEIVENFNSTTLFDVFMKYSAGYDNIFYMYGDCPFLDPEASQRIYKNHLKYFAQYSFADGGPYGIMPEIISAEIAGALKVLAEKQSTKVERDTIFKTIQKDINSFDIETDISEKDLRLLRISLTADSKRNFLLLDKFIEKKGSCEKEITRVIEENGELLRTLPAFFQIQISEKCCQKCSYCPYPLINPDLLNSSGYMDSENYRIILDKIKEFSDDAVVSLSYWGDPSLNPEIEKIINITMEYDRFSLLIETSGLGWDKGVISLLSEKYGNRITWIVSLDTGNEDLYMKIRGEGYAEALSAAEYFLEKFPETAYVQAVRMKETEEHLEDFFKYWKKKTENVIIQKYDCFSGFLDERKVTDISPLKRFPCWHLKRDLNILINGDVPVCREDLKKETILGNIFTDSISDIWENGENIYKEHLNKNYNGICRMCDEYYTYNF